MKIKTNAFEDGKRILEKYTADGENVNPELVVFEIPEEAKSLVLIVDDPDAKRVCGFTWVHWVVFDVPVEGSELIIKENSIPGLSGMSTYKKKEYGGPNPPKGTGIHNYYFKVFALDTFLGLGEMSELEEIEKSMKCHVLGNVEIIGQYSRD